MANKTKKKVAKEATQVKKDATKKIGDHKLRARDYRNRAINITKPMRGDFAVVYLVYALITAAAYMLFYIISLFVNGAFNFGCIHLAKQARKSGEKPTVSGLFYGFKERYGQSLAVYIVTVIFTALWTLLLIIPGIIKSYSYAMSPYIALDNPSKSTLDCITESRKLMKGHKWQLFCLQISHIGWFILVILTLGILSFWVMPKYQQAIYEFYLHISHKD